MHNEPLPENEIDALLANHNWLPVPRIAPEKDRPMWIVVTGARKSGKTTFIKTICDDYVWWNFSKGEAVESQPGLQGNFFLSSCGRFRVDNDLIVNFLDIPGSRRFDAMFKIKREQLLGFVLTVDSVDMTNLRETRSLTATMQTYFNVPYVVAATRQDHPDAWSIEDIRIALGLVDFFTGKPEGAKVIPCMTSSRESVKRVLLALLYRSIASLGYDDYTVQT